MDGGAKNNKSKMISTLLHDLVSWSTQSNPANQDVLASSKSSKNEKEQSSTEHGKPLTKPIQNLTFSELIFVKLMRGGV